jgi:hypothetical protein
MKKILLLNLIFLVSLGLNAQSDTTKYWKTTGKASLNFNENYFSNWAAGGENAYGTVGQFEMDANYKNDKVIWTNHINMRLGYSVLGSSKLLKTADQIEWFSTYKNQLNKKWLFTVLGSFKTQFAKGFDYKVDSSTAISGFLAPMTLDIGPGLQYTANKYLSINLSPASARLIYVNSQRLADAGSFGLKPAVTDSSGRVLSPAKKYTLGLGIRVFITLDYPVAKNVNLNSRLSLYSDFFHNPQNIDVDWQVVLDMKVNNWLNVDISTQLLYDDDVMITDSNGKTGPRVQFKQLLLLGIGYKF